MSNSSKFLNEVEDELACLVVPLFLDSEGTTDLHYAVRRAVTNLRKSVDRETERLTKAGQLGPMPEEEKQPYKNPNQRGLEGLIAFLLGRLALQFVALIIVPLLLVGAIGWAVWMWWK